MNILDSFFMLFEADTSKLDKGIDESDKKAGKFVKTLEGIDKHLGTTFSEHSSFIEKAVGLAGIGIALGAVYLGVKRTAEEYHQLEKLALQFRSTVEAVHEFREASGLLGITEEESTESLTGLEMAVQDVHLGMGRAKRVFDELGINVHDANGKIKSTTLVLDELAGKFKKMDKGTQIRVMDRLGLNPKLLLLFNADIGALQRRMTEVDRAAGFNLQLAVKRAGEYTKASRGLSVELNVLKLFLGKLSEVTRIAALPWLVKGMELATVYVRKFTDFLMNHTRLVQGVFIAIAGVIATYLIPAAISGALAVWAMIAPFALIAAAVLGVVTVFALLYDDIQAFREGNESLIGNILKRWPEVGEVIGDVGEVLKFLGDTVADLLRIFLALNGVALRVFGGIATAAGDMAALIGESVSQLVDMFTAWLASFDLVRSAFGGMGDSVGGVLRMILDLITQVWDKLGGVVGIAKTIAGLVRGALGSAKTSLGIEVPPATAAAVAAGRTQLNAAAASPLSSVTSSSISNAATTRGGDRNLTVEKIEIQTQATDADGISRDIGTALGSQLRQATNHFDDGVLA